MINFIIIPLYNEPSFGYSTTLENLSVTLKFTWNTRTLHHHLTVTKQDGTVLVDSMKLVEEWPMQTSGMYENGLSGVFLFTPVTSSVESTSDTREKCADNFILSYSY